MRHKVDLFTNPSGAEAGGLATARWPNLDAELIPATRYFAGHLRCELRSEHVELVVEVDGGVDQRQVAGGLGEVAQLLAGRADLLGVRPRWLA
jgi:hypothetical protein